METCGISVNQADSCLRNLKNLAEQWGDLGTAVDDFDPSPQLAEFLLLCANSVSSKANIRNEPHAGEFFRARDVFLRAGLEALTARRWPVDNDWVQIGIRPRGDPGQRSELYRQVSSLARQLLGDSAIDNFFFMNKSPGMRLRFQISAPGSVTDVTDVLHAEVARWHAEGLIDHIEPGVYEPESQLFGGPQSMSFVHALFTVDSLIWLDFHARRTVETDETSPDWLMSLAVLRIVFAGLDITGWEDLGVWDGIRGMAGRRLGRESAKQPPVAEIASEIRGVWSRRDQIVEKLDPANRAIVANYEGALLTGASHWRSGYFCQREATRGPRTAAVFYVIFHWNRGALPPIEQALLAESLSERMFNDGH